MAVGGCQGHVAGIELNGTEGDPAIHENVIPRTAPALFDPPDTEGCLSCCVGGGLARPAANENSHAGSRRQSAHTYPYSSLDLTEAEATRDSDRRSRESSRQVALV